MTTRCILTILCSGLLSIPLSAQETAFTYQGQLNESDRRVTGTYEFRFTLFDAETGGNALGAGLTVSGVGVTNGLFQVLLDFGAADLGPAARWLAIQVRTNDPVQTFTDLTPRQRLTPTPRSVLATSAETAATVPPGSITSDRVAAGTLLAGNLAAGQVVRSLNGLHDDVVLEGGANVVLTPSAAGLRLDSTGWGLQGNAGTIAGQDFLGTTDDRPLELRAANLPVLRLQVVTNGNSVNVIAGHPGNRAIPSAEGATIAGGGVNYGAGVDFAQVVASSFGTIGGGYGNVVGTNCFMATIAGGRENVVLPGAHHCAIGGGWRNLIEGHTPFWAGPLGYSTIAGGYLNSVGVDSPFATIGGGFTNRIEGEQSVISGGSVNHVGPGSLFCAIGGGSGNVIEGNTRTGTIAGGGRNRISEGAIRSVIGGGVDHRIGAGSEHAVIGGGQTNEIAAGSPGAVIPGGISNRVAGAHTLAAGYRARAEALGAFAWADATEADFSVSTANEFGVRATGGVRLVTAVDSFGAPTNGVSVPPGGGAWETMSDEHAKTGFQEIDPLAVLEKVAALPVRSWIYKAEASGARHVGPTAQAFHQAFRLGTDERHLSTVDVDGVALAAIQGLHRLLLEQGREIEVLRQELAVLRAGADGSR